MSKPAIIFDNVSKSYQLKHQVKYNSARDAIIGSARRYLPFCRKPKAATTDDETFWALKDISFEIQPGEAVGIIGPNGSGKSTSLKILSGVTQPTKGRYELNGRLGALLEVGAGFHPDLTGRENVYMNGSILGMKKAEIDRKFDAIVDFSELERFIDTPVKHYSSGMYVRLGFAVAVHNEPDIMLVDEALAVGDLSFQKKCFDKIHDIIKSGRTFVLVSHAMNQIQETCKRAILLNKGELLADGDPIDISEQYISLSGSLREIPANNEQEQLKIKKISLTDEEGNRFSTAPINTSLILEIDYTTDKRIKKPVFTVNIYRGTVRVYSSNTSHEKSHIEKIEGEGTVRCTIPPISLMPNIFDIEVGVWNQAQDSLIGYLKVKEALTIATPKNILDIGGYLHPTQLNRAIVYSPSSWKHL